MQLSLVQKSVRIDCKCISSTANVQTIGKRATAADDDKMLQLSK